VAEEEEEEEEEEAMQYIGIGFVVFTTNCTCGYYHQH
jgi:hypothetical protein